MEDLVPKVQKAFESAFGIDQERVTIDSTPSDIPARDSMGHLQLASSLEGSGYRQKSDTPKSFARRVCNRLLHQLARSLPGASSLRPFLHRLRGVKIHGKVYIGDDVYLENEYPECIEIHDEVQIGLRTTVIAHTRGPYKPEGNEITNRRSCSEREATPLLC